MPYFTDISPKIIDGSLKRSRSLNLNFSMNDAVLPSNGRELRMRSNIYLRYSKFGNNVSFLRLFLFLLSNRHLREQASIALKNISANPNRTTTLSALSQVAAGKPQSTDKGSWNSDSSGTFCNENNAQRPSTSHLLKTASNGTMLDRESSLLKPQQSISEMTSLLTLVFQSDALSRSGSERKFVTPNHLNGLRSARLKQSHNFSKQDKYLSSLRVLTNALVVMSNAILITGNIGDESGELSVEVRYVCSLYLKGDIN